MRTLLFILYLIIATICGISIYLITPSSNWLWWLEIIAAYSLIISSVTFVFTVIFTLRKQSKKNISKLLIIGLIPTISLLYTDENINPFETKTQVKKGVSVLKTTTISHNNFNLNDFNLCTKLSIEINEENNIIDSLPNINTDSIKIKSVLISNGFEQTDYGWGNWQDGPRFSYAKMVKDSCVCHLYRKYKLQETQPMGYQSIKISERIICNSDMYMDE